MSRVRHNPPPPGPPPPAPPPPPSPRDADPLDVTDALPKRYQYPRVEPVNWTTNADPRLLGFREQRRRSRWGCSVALLAIVAALVVFWVGLALVVREVVAAPLVYEGPAVGIVRERSAASASRASVPASEQATNPARPPIPVARGASDSLSTLTYTGTINYAQPSHGRWYLAIPNGPGWRVRICGPAGCLDRTSTDAGPSLAMQRAGKIADLNSVDWQQISGVSLRYGGFQGTVLVLGRARLPETDMDSIASSGFGMHGAPRLEMTARCSSSGHQSVWVAQTGTAFLDIIQVGAMDGEFFYAYGRGEPLGPGSLYVEEKLGPSGIGSHRYGVTLGQHKSFMPAANPTAARLWTLTIDGRVVATIPDTFRTWRLRATQVMAEGDLPFGAASCSFPAGSWHFGGYGPQPAYSFGARDWRVNG